MKLLNRFKRYAMIWSFTNYACAKKRPTTLI